MFISFFSRSPPQVSAKTRKLLFLGAGCGMLTCSRVPCLDSHTLPQSQLLSPKQTIARYTCSYTYIHGSIESSCSPQTDSIGWGWLVFSCQSQQLSSCLQRRDPWERRRSRAAAPPHSGLCVCVWWEILSKKLFKCLLVLSVQHLEEVQRSGQFC